MAGATLHTHLDLCLPALLASLYLEPELAEAEVRVRARVRIRVRVRVRVCEP